MSSSVLKRIPWRSPLLWVVVLQVVLLGWIAFRVGQVYLDLNAAKSAASKVESALKDQRVDDAKKQSSILTARAADAANGTSGPTWKALEHLPFVGDDVRTIGRVSEVVDLIARRVIPPAIEAADVVQGDGVIGKGGAIDLKAIEQIAPDVRSARRGVADAGDRLSAVRTTGNLRKISSAFGDLRKTVDDLSSMLDSADRALAVLPAMAGSSGPRRYLLVLQNNAEIRSSAGLPGVIVPLLADQGRIERGDPVSTSTAFPELVAPVLPLSAAEQALFGDFLGRHVTEANLTPDFPRTAELIAARWERDGDGQVDGVLMMDTVTLAYLLKATGPITVDGIRLTEDNAVQQLLADTYVRLAGKYVAQDAFFQAVADKVFSKLTSGKVNAPNLLKALSKSASEGRLRVRSFDPREARVMADTEIAGTIADAESRAEVGVYVNDVTSAKMSIFLDYALNVTSSTCRSGVQSLVSDLVLTSSAPKDMSAYDRYVKGRGTNAPFGSQALSIALVAPTAGKVESVSVNGREQTLDVRMIGGRKTVVVRIVLGPGQTTHFKFKVATAGSNVGDVRFDVTPSVVPGVKSATVIDSCSLAR